MKNSLSREIMWSLGMGKPKTKNIKNSGDFPWDNYDSYTEYENDKYSMKSEVVQVPNDDFVKFPDRNVWVMTTNFAIPFGKEWREKLNQIQGLESFKPVAKYTALVSAGILFNEEAVKNKIETLLNAKRVL